jgi:subtilase family serine protease
MSNRLTVVRLVACIFAILILGAFIAACGGGGGGGGGTLGGSTVTLVPTPTPKPTPTPTPKPVACKLLPRVRVAQVGVLPRPPMIPTLIAPGPAVRVCPQRSQGHMHCLSWRRTDISPGAIGGYHPSDLQAAYNLAAASASGGVNQTVAVVDAYHDPNAEADLGVYRSQWGLPACTTANGCFLQVNQSGMTSPVAPVDPTAGWEEEESLDVDMVSAICPNCGIVLVEATDSSGGNLYTAENTAANMCGAAVISNSWDGGEYSSETFDESNFNHPGVMITFAAGDNSYAFPGDGYPVSSQYVTAVGGTTLKHVGSTWTETVWNGSGSLCSAYISQPPWQASTATVIANPGVCSMRIDNDVAAVGDPNTGVAVYDTYKDPGWLVFGGTSVATPIIAGVYAIAGNGATLNAGSFSYSHTGSLNDVTSGNNSTGPPPTPCPNYLCLAGTGYDGPTGNGTPNGTGGF